MNYTYGAHTHTWTQPTWTVGTLTSSPITTQTLWNDIYDHINKQPKGPEMTTLEKVKRERQEAIERKRIEAMYSDYDELNLEACHDDTVFLFVWVRDDDHTYTYVALKAKGHWYVTGGSAPNGLATEDFVAWLIGKKIPSVALVEMVSAS